MATSYSARIPSERIALKQTRTLCVWQAEMLPMNKYTDHPGPSKSSEYTSGINVVDPEPSSDTIMYHRKPTFRSRTGQDRKNQLAATRPRIRKKIKK